MARWKALVAALVAVLALLGPAAADPSPEEAYRHGRAALQAGRTEEAAAWLRAAVRERPRKAEWHLWLGRAFLALGQREDAETEWRLAAALDPGGPVGRAAAQELANPARPAAGAPASGVTWTHVGRVDGLEGDDWMLARTGTCRVWVRDSSRGTAEAVVAGLDAEYRRNAAYMGFSARTPLEVYLLPVDGPMHEQARFREFASGRRAAGLAVSQPRMALIDLGGARQEPLSAADVLGTCRHELNHLFMYDALAEVQSGTDWDWLLEGVAERITAGEDELAVRTTFSMAALTVLPESWADWTRERAHDEYADRRDYAVPLISIVTFLEQRNGPDVIRRLVKAGRRMSLREAFLGVCGASPEQLEREWRSLHGLD